MEQIIPIELLRLLEHLPSKNILDQLPQLIRFIGQFEDNSWIVAFLVGRNFEQIYMFHDENFMSF